MSRKNQDSVRGNMYLIKALTLSAAFATGAAAGVLVLGGASFASEAGSGDVPTDVAVDHVVSAGTGCPGGDIAAELLSPTELQIDVDSLEARMGSDIPMAQSRQSCQQIISLTYPAGWTFIVEDASGEFSARLHRGALATLLFSAYFQGEETTATAGIQLAGPLSLPQKEQAITFDEEVSSPCDAQRALIFKTAVATQKDEATAVKPYGRITAEGPFLLHLRWERCDD